MGYQSIVVLTGAGISVESGIDAFRVSGGAGLGLWENHPIEEVATPEGFKRDPARVHRFYNARRAQLLSAAVQPNKAHNALVKLEEHFKDRFMLVTQNVDNLHERAGSKSLIHMHGELLNVRCVESGYVSSVKGDVTPMDRCVCCGLTGTLRPDIVWFGEEPLYMNQIYDALSYCDLFISIGTSGHVYPAAGFVEVANQAGALSIEINLEPSRKKSHFKERYYGPASEQVADFVDHLINAS